MNDEMKQETVEVNQDNNEKKSSYSDDLRRATQMADSSKIYMILSIVSLVVGGVILSSISYFILKSKLEEIKNEISVCNLSEQDLKYLNGVVDQNYTITRIIWIITIALFGAMLLFIFLAFLISFMSIGYTNFY